MIGAAGGRRRGVLRAAIASAVAACLDASAPAQQATAELVRWVVVPEGSFAMGCTPGDAECFADELPSHQVTFTHGFAMTATEVTAAQFRAFTLASGRAAPPPPPFPQADDHPAVNVTHGEAAAACAWLGGRLPTEAEWEYAARGGRPASRYPNGDTIDLTQANFEGTGGRDLWTATAPVASFAANGYDLHDMAGNVWEWCADAYAADRYAAAPATDPGGPPAGAVRVVRGGAWNAPPRSLRVSNRGRAAPDSRLSNVGFRCTRDLAPSSAGAAASPAPAATPALIAPQAGTAPDPVSEAGAAAFGQAAMPAASAVPTAGPPPHLRPTPAALERRRFPPSDADMVLLPAGEYEQGCVRGDADCDADEQPRHRVVFASPFWCDVTEVTAARYLAFAAATGARAPEQREWSGPDHPVVSVTWQEADAYCRWAGGRLPSEAEWEYAARGGVAGAKYPGGGAIRQGEVNGDGTGGADRWEKTAPVGSFPANGFGLADMIGNVWEWCADVYDPVAYARAASGSPPAAAGRERVVRGGSWTSAGGRMRISYRFRLDPAESSIAVGFRCVRDQAP